MAEGVLLGTEPGATTCELIAGRLLTGVPYGVDPLTEVAPSAGTELPKVPRPTVGGVAGDDVGATLDGGTLLLSGGIPVLVGVAFGTGCSGAGATGAGADDDGVWVELPLDGGLTGSVPEVGVTRGSLRTAGTVSLAGARVPASLEVGPTVGLGGLKLLPFAERSGLPITAAGLLP